MSRGYKVDVIYRHGLGKQELYLNATIAGLRRMLHMLDQSADVESFAVFESLTVPALSILGKLNQTSIPIESKKLK